jgi:hypothetical protein
MQSQAGEARPGQTENLHLLFGLHNNPYGADYGMIVNSAQIIKIAKDYSLMIHGHLSTLRAEIDQLR